MLICKEHNEEIVREEDKILQIWKTHFEGLLNEDIESNIKEQMEQQNYSPVTPVKGPTRKEVAENVEQLKNEKRS